MKLIRLLVVIVGALVCQLALAQYEPYTIEDFKVRIQLKKDGWMDVQESIHVLFNEPRHGIFRFIPVNYDTGRQFGRRIVMKGISVTDESGSVLATLVNQDGPNVSIRIGDKDVLLAPGTRRTYIIRYSTYGMLNWFDEGAKWTPTVELYWNLTGNEWDTTIKRTSFEVQFPKVDDVKNVHSRIFTGAYGSRTQQTTLGVAKDVYGEQSEFTVTQAKNGIRAERLTPLSPYNGATLVLSIPANVIPQPGLATTIWMIVTANMGLLNPVIVFVGLSLLWFWFGRDPKGGPVVVQFDRPLDLGPAECGAMLDERVDQRDVAAAIVSLAQKGFLKIEAKVSEGVIFRSHTTILHVLSNADKSNLTLFEAELFTRLSKCGDTVTESELSSSVAPHIGELKDVIYDDVARRGYYLANPNKTRQVWIGLGLLVVVLLAYLLHKSSLSFSPVPAVLGAIVSAVVVIVFGLQMPKRTQGGSRVRQQVVGFEEFIRRAHKNELDWMSKRQPDQALYEEYLPYAMAFGLGAVWARAFESIVLTQPNWYAGPFNSHTFADDLNSSTNRAATAASIPPRSSGGSGGSSGFSSGGGFSGGGFGGGGGGSW